MKKTTIIGLGITVILGITLMSGCGAGISYANKDTDLKNRFKAKLSERTAFYDKMFKTISQKGQVAVRNDSSFQSNINAIMAGRKDAEGVFMKWVQESNPNANFEQVSALYSDLSRTIEAERDGFFEREKELQNIKYLDDNMMDQFPGNVLLSMIGRAHIEYKPITSDQTDDVIKTGKDNNIKVF